MHAPTKDEMRQRMAELRAEAAARDPDAGEKLAGKFPMKLLDRFGPTVAGYIPIGSEIDPQPLMARLEKSGAQLCLPRVDDDGATMTYRLWSTGEPLEARRFGLKEPHEDAPVVRPTLILTPLLAFDATGARLGYGKGHYDRAISALRADGRVFTCAVGFQIQRVEAVPVETHDEPLDWAVTPGGSVPLFLMRGFKQNAAPDPDGPSAA